MSLHLNFHSLAAYVPFRWPNTGRYSALCSALCLSAGVVIAEPLLMTYEEYMDRCMSTYGEDKVTRSVCDAQFQAIEKKEQDLMAHVEVSQSVTGISTQMSSPSPSQASQNKRISSDGNTSLSEKNRSQNDEMSQPDNR